MKLLKLVGRKDSTLWENVRPLLVLSFSVFTPLVVVMMIYGVFGGFGDNTISAKDFITGVLMAVLLPIGFSAFMGTYFFFLGRIIPRINNQ